uniref:Metal-dependent phosphohydrolase, HD subdomain n=1 Tax=Dechloromonas aromatica (strain RCB) TaxID=159087 RepID=Q47H23_DECAR
MQIPPPAASRYTSHPFKSPQSPRNPMQTLVERVAAHIKAKFLAESSGHDWHHINRVWQLTRQIAAQEGANREIAELGALVHDIADWKFHDGDDSVGPREAEILLLREGASDAVIAAVVDIVATISYKGAGVTTAMQTLEGQCVQDADRLDAIGAIGIARCFAYGGHAGRLMHDPDEAPVMHQTAAAYKASKGASLNHFYEKLFLLKERMNTPTGRALAEPRHQFMEDFVAQFLAEWNVAG